MIVGIGIDLAEVERYRFDERALAWFSRKVYTEEEMAYALRKRHWPERLAGFFAAKEATRKAFADMRFRGAGWCVARTQRQTDHPIYGKAEALPASRNIGTIHFDDHALGDDCRGRCDTRVLAKMIAVLTPQEMRDADAEAWSASVGVDALMDNAGNAIAAYVREHVPPGSRIVAFAGPGNNGGDRVSPVRSSEYDCVLYGPDRAAAR